MSPPRRKANARPKPRPPANDPAFWGEPDADEDDVELIRPTDEPAAMITSLGPAPLPSRETIAEHYFLAIYDRAAALAVALAASSDLLDTPEPGE
jgi:hypothetical protein